MGIWKGFCGFEHGDRFGWTTWSGNIFLHSDGTAHTGDYFARVNQRTAAAGGYGMYEVCGNFGHTVTLGEGEKARGVMSTWFRLPRGNHAGASPISIGGIYHSFWTVYAFVDSSGYLYCRVGNSGTGSAGTYALQANTWYRLRFEWYLENQSGISNHKLSGSVKVYNEAGTLLDTVTDADYFVFTTTTLGQPTIGDRIGGVSAAHYFDYDDIVWEFRYQADYDAAYDLDHAYRVSAPRTAANGASQNFTGYTPAYKAIWDMPCIHTDPVVHELASSGAANDESTFTHEGYATQNMGSTIYGVSINTKAKSTAAATTGVVRWRGADLRSLALQTNYRTDGAYWGDFDFTQLTGAQFDAGEYGFKCTTTAVHSIAQVSIEALHKGDGYGVSTPRPVWTGSVSWVHKAGTYTGDGTNFRTIAHGLGYTPQLVFIRVQSGTTYGLETGFTWNCFMPRGSAKAHSLDLVCQTAIQKVDDTYIYISDHVNRSSAVYSWFAAQDGGAHTDGYLLTVGVYLPDGGTDPLDIVSYTAVQPEVLLTFGSTYALYRDESMAVDFCMVVGSSSTTSNGIQDYNVDGFELGGLSYVGTNGKLTPYFYIRDPNNRLRNFFDWGRHDSTGTSETVTGILFPPYHVFADRANIGDACVRCLDVAAHSTNLSSPWTSPNSHIATGITAMNADGFDVGSTLAVAGQRFYWMAWDTEGSVSIVETTPDPEEPWVDNSPGLLGVVVQALQHTWDTEATPPLTFPVPCEQRTFPVEFEDRTDLIECEQWTFIVDPYDWRYK